MMAVDLLPLLWFSALLGGGAHWDPGKTTNLLKRSLKSAKAEKKAKQKVKGSRRRKEKRLLKICGNNGTNGYSLGILKGWEVGREVLVQ